MTKIPKPAVTADFLLRQLGVVQLQMPFSKMDLNPPCGPFLNGIKKELRRSKHDKLNVPIRISAPRALFAVATALCFKFLPFPGRYLHRAIRIHCARLSDLLLVSHMKWPGFACPWAEEHKQSITVLGDIALFLIQRFLPLTISLFPAEWLLCFL